MLSHHLKKISKLFFSNRKKTSSRNVSETNPGNFTKKTQFNQVLYSQRNKTKVQVNSEDSSLMLQDWWIN